MIHVIAILGNEVVIVHNDTTVSNFEQKSEYTPLRGYYDGMFHYTIARRLQLRTDESIKRSESKYYNFDGLFGISIKPNGELHAHVLTTQYTDEGHVLGEQVAEFQGLVGTMGDSWFGGDTYIINALSLAWEQTHTLDPNVLFPLLDPTRGSSVSLTIARIKIDALLQSIEMFNKGIGVNDIIKMWDIVQYERPIEMKVFGIDDVQEFNATNLAQITTYYTEAVDKTS